jgi:sarcosine oxidase subunit gamma
VLEPRPAIGRPPFQGDGFSIQEIGDRSVLSLATASPPAEWPEPGNSTDWQGGRLIRLGPDQGFWLGGQAIDPPDGFYITDQSDSWAIVALKGDNALRVMERLCPLDLARWPIGAAARSMLEHLAVIVVKSGDTEFELLSPRSTALDFWHALTTTRLG